MQNNFKKKISWYQKTWAIVLFLFLFFPVGLFLMWKYSKFKTVPKAIITALVAFIFIGSVLESPNNSTNNITTANKQQETTIQNTNSKSDSEELKEKEEKEKQEKIVAEQKAAEEKARVEAKQKEVQEAEAAKIAAEKKAKEEAENARIQAEKEEQQRQAQQQVVAQAKQKAEKTIQNNPENGEMVWLSATGKKYHRINNCGNMNPNKARQVTKDQAIQGGYDPCKKCW